MGNGRGSAAKAVGDGNVTGEAVTKSVRRRPGRPTLSNEELLDTALDLFLEKGFERTSIDAITAAAGMAKRTIYARYGDKTNLFKAALTRAIEEWIVPIERLRAAETADFEATLIAIGQILVENTLSPAGLRLLRLTNAESVKMPEISIYNVQHGTEPTLAYLADLFRSRLDHGKTTLEDAQNAAQAFLDLVVGGVANNAALGFAIEPKAVEQHTRYCVRLLLYGLLAEAPSPGGQDHARIKNLLDQATGQLDDLRGQLEMAKRLAGN